MENLLGTYQELEQSFMENVYELQKALGFSTLWVLDDVMRSFQRIASESAFGTGRLNGVLELTKVLQQLSDITFKAEKCFSRLRYSKGVQKWSFDNETNTQVKNIDIEFFCVGLMDFFSYKILRLPMMTDLPTTK